MIDVHLTPAEGWQAVQLGAKRNYKSKLDGRRDRYGVSADQGWDAHIQGAAGELALAKALGLRFIPTIDTFKAPDVAGLQVRTRTNHEWELIVRDSDADDELFVHVTGDVSSLLFVVRGYILGADAKQPQWAKDHGGHGQAWFVPSHALRPISTLNLEVTHGADVNTVRQLHVGRQTGVDRSTEAA